MSTQILGLAHAPRLLCAGAALLLNGALAASVLGLFDQASPRMWVPASPMVSAAVAACDAKAGRAERHDCRLAVVAAHRSGGSTRLAQAAPR